MDHQVHGGETIRTLTAQKPVPAKADKMKGVVVVEDAGCFVPPRADSVPEGRVHGGSLMALLAKGTLLGQYEGQPEGGSTSSNQVSSYNMIYGFM